MEINFKICIECNNFFNEIYQFLSKTRLINQMFIEIEQQKTPEVSMNQEGNQESCVDSTEQPNDLEYEKMINDTRQKFGLKPLEIQVESLSNLFDESNITGALEIKLESDAGDFEIADALSEEQEHCESSEEEEEEEDDEDESEIEQLSDSQLKRHEESLQYNNESSDSGREERKKRRKKYRKSDEEKLFE
jgi:hypothetical protein